MIPSVVVAKEDVKVTSGWLNEGLNIFGALDILPGAR
jgi:hypothetical protein